MFKVLSLFLFTALIASAELLSLDAPDSVIDSIRVHATTITNNIELPLTVITKRKAGIRATIQPPQSQRRAVVLFNNDNIYLITALDKDHVEVLAADDAAKNLFEMLTLHPDFHFRTKELGYRTSILEDYTINIKRDRLLENETLGKPLSAELYRKSDGKLIRSIEYLDFFPARYVDYYQPQIIHFTDHEAALEGVITLDTVAYNVGAANFIFELPKGLK